MGRRTYTENEKNFLYEYIPGHSYKEIRESFNDKFQPSITLEQIRNFIRNNKLTTGRTGRFEKGYISHNKGKKMSPEMYKAAAPTMFKEGRKPKNTLPVGTEKVLADGYIWVKIDDKPKVEKRVNWKQKHRIEWEKANGPVPEGCIITFLDGNRLNCELSNLKMVHRRIGVIMNQNKLYSKDKRITESGIMVASLIDATKRKKKNKGKSNG